MKKLLPVLLLSFVNVVGFSILIPILPEMVQQYVATKYLSIAYGAILSSYAFSQFLAAPLLGSLSDRYGRKPILVLSQVGTIISWLIFTLAYFAHGRIVFGWLPVPLLIIIISRIADGITGGNISVAQAWVSDSTVKEERTKVFGMMGGVFGLGFLLGPIIGGYSYSLGPGLLGTIFVALIISIITLFLIVFVLPESLPYEKRAHHLNIKLLSEVNIFNKFNLFKSEEIKKLLYIRIIFAFVFAAYTTTITLLLQIYFGLSVYQLGEMLAAIGLFSITNQAFFVPKLGKKYGELKSFYVGIFIIFVSMLVMPLLPSKLMVGSFNLALPMLLVSAFFVNLGLSLNITTFRAYLANSVEPHQQGQVTGLDASILAFGSGLSPLLSGFLYSLLGNYTFLVFALLLAIPSLYTLLTTSETEKVLS